MRLLIGQLPLSIAYSGTSAVGLLLTTAPRFNGIVGATRSDPDRRGHRRPAPVFLALQPPQILRRRCQVAVIEEPRHVFNRFTGISPQLRCRVPEDVHAACRQSGQLQVTPQIGVERPARDAPPRAHIGPQGGRGGDRGDILTYARQP